MTAKKLKPAGEVDAYCTKCKLDLMHRIISMEGDKPHQVECLTCRTHHLYRKPKTAVPEAKPAKVTKASSGPSSSGGGKSTSAKALAAAAAEAQREKGWEKRVAGQPVTAFKPYRPTATFDEGDLVRHSKFGDGYVARVLEVTKIEVMFKDGLRTLAMGIEAAS